MRCFYRVPSADVGVRSQGPSIHTGEQATKDRTGAGLTADSANIVCAIRGYLQGSLYVLVFYICSFRALC